MPHKNHFNNGAILTLLIACVLFVIFYMLSLHIFIYCDVAWHIEGGRRILAGGSYISNLFDDNPPMVFWVYAPLAWLERIMGFSGYRVALAYIFILYAICSIFILKVFRLIFKDRLELNLFFYATLMAVLILGMVITGQREVFAMYFMTPYLFVNLLEYKPSRRLGLFIALFAVIGIAQLPYYAILLFILDCLQCFARKKMPSFHQYAFYVCLFIVLLSFYFIYPAYYTVILKYYYIAQKSVNASYSEILQNVFFKIPCFGFVLTIMASYLYGRDLLHVKLVVLVFIGLINYLLLAKHWYIHIYPALYAFFIIYAFLLLDIRSNKNKQFNYVTAKAVAIIYTVIVVFTVVCIGSAYLYYLLDYIDKKDLVNRMITFSRSINQKSNKVFFFNLRVELAYISKIYGGLNNISPWANNWLLPSVVNGYAPAGAKDIIFNLTLNALRRQPTYVIYHQEKQQPYIKQRNFDYLEYFKQDKRIAKQLEHYHFLKKIGYFVILKKS